MTEPSEKIPKLPRRAIPLVLLLLLFVTGLAGWEIMNRGSFEGWGSSTRAPVEFSVARDSEGHRVHFRAEQEIACLDCHEQGEGEEVDPAIRLDACLDCHEEHAPEALATADHLHAALEGDERLDCVDCHDFRNVDPHPAADCARCHTGPEASATVVDRHVDVGCPACHQPHRDPPTDPISCLTCHDGRANGHGDPEISPARRCLDCHDLHGEEDPPPIERCATCHATEEPRVQPLFALFPGHDACSNCHQGHEFTAESAVRCTSCHEGVAVMGAPGAQPHNNCRSCHSPHAPLRTPKSRCAQCHQEVRTDHPAPADNCTSCHIAHPGDGHTRQDIQQPLPCSSCHDQASGRQAPHAPGLECGSCHQPHEFALEGSFAERCVGCHEAPVQSTSQNAGHQDCSSCHGASVHHGPSAQPAACSQCHEEQHRTAPGGHRQCRTCHEPHTGQRLESAQSCVQCHDAQAAGSHGGGRLECSNCHLPHGPGEPASPPRCASCHVFDELPGMHGLEAHAERCVDCHDLHGLARLGLRETCVGCHEDQQDHVPEAEVCTGCHVFRSAPGTPPVMRTPYSRGAVR